jgi:pimeloyl-ACP methyl ester carboxylesterase
LSLKSNLEKEMGNKKDKTPFIMRVVRWVFPKVERLLPSVAHRYFVKIFFTPFRYRVPEKEIECAKAAEQFTFEAAGKKIQAYRWGKGPIVVFVHGWAGRATQFRKFVDICTGMGYQAIAIDGPAHGCSTGKKTNLIEFKDALLELFKLLPQQPIGVITHSFGGVAALYSIVNDLPVTKLVNIASPTIGDEIIRTYLRAINGTARTGDSFKDYMIKTYGKSFDEFSSLHFAKHLPRLVNLLLVYDENDKEVIIKHAEELIKIYPSAQLHRTKGLGHTRILKDDQVIETAIRFITS